MTLTTWDQTIYPHGGNLVPAGIITLDVPDTSLIRLPPPFSTGLVVNPEHTMTFCLSENEKYLFHKETANIFAALNLYMALKIIKESPEYATKISTCPPSSWSTSRTRGRSRQTYGDIYIDNILSRTKMVIDDFHACDITIPDYVPLDVWLPYIRGSAEYKIIWLPDIEYGGICRNYGYRPERGPDVPKKSPALVWKEEPDYESLPANAFYIRLWPKGRNEENYSAFFYEYKNHVKNYMKEVRGCKVVESSHTL